MTVTNNIREIKGPVLIRLVFRVAQDRPLRCLVLLIEPVRAILVVGGAGARLLQVAGINAKWAEDVSPRVRHGGHNTAAIMCYNVIGDIPSFCRLEIIDMPAKTPDSYFENAINAYVAGKSIEDSAGAFHVSYNRLKTALTERGLLRDATTSEQLRRQHLRDTARTQDTLPIDEIAARYMAGESENAIAQSFGVARNVIRLRLQRSGVAIRDQTTANRLLIEQRTADERSQYAQAAHDARRGRKDPVERLERRAQARQHKQLGVSPAELLLKEWL